MAKPLKAVIHKSTPFIVMDYETGGIDCTKHAITELAAIALRGDTLEEIGRMQTLVRPYAGYDYDQVALNITGISREMLINDGVPLEKCADMFYKLCEEAKEACGDGRAHKPVIVAQNALFEVKFTQQMMHVTKKDFSKVLQGNTDFFGNFQPLFIDTIPQAKLIWAADKRMTSYKLENICGKAAIDLNAAHRALGDTIATKEFLVYVAKAMRAGEGGGNLEAGKELSIRQHFQF